uniref:Uncharacterized protein n=1 Tax=viral metagenome TaxID=1070528 RepID=A0A6H1ZZH1_9ZZZZ
MENKEKEKMTLEISEFDLGFFWGISMNPDLYFPEKVMSQLADLVRKLQIKEESSQSYRC